MSTGPVLGIDLGTTNTVVAVAEQGGVRVISDREGRKLIPSVVSFHSNGEVLVGADAKERRLLDAKNTVYSTKRLLGRPYASDEVQRAKDRFAFDLVEVESGGVGVRAREQQFSLPEVSAFVLREAKATAERALREKCSRAVVTVPASFNELQRSATKAAAQIAGLDVLRIINEPTAAALAYGYSRGARERIAVYDLGGGTFDLTILQLSGDVFEVIATAGDSFLGGDDVDLLLADEMAKAFLREHRYDLKSEPQAFERLKSAAEWAKCQLSSRDRVHLRVEELAYDTGGKPIDFEFSFSRRQLEDIAKPLVRGSFDVCDEAMRIAAVLPSQLDAVLLVGGSTRMPLVRTMVEEYFEREPLMHVDPDLVVAQGAALQGFVLSGRPMAAAPSQVARVALTKSVAPRAATNRPRALFEEVRTSSGDPRSEEIDVLAILASNEDEDTANFRRSSLAPSPSSQLPSSSAGASSLPRLPSVPPPLPRRNVAAGAFDPSPMENDPFAHLDADEHTDVSSADDDGDTVRFVEQVAVGPAMEDDLVDAKAKPPRLAPPLPPALRPATMGATTLSGMPATRGDESAEPAHFAFTPDAQPPALELPMAPSVLPVASLGSGTPPLLLDVTPHSLCIETVGGFCEPIIARNTTIPIEQSRVFTTGRDMQQDVEAKICQGESRVLASNQVLGTISLSGLRPALRGEVKIEVTFTLDADGTLGVRARDIETQRQELVRISLIGGLSQEQIESATKRHQALFGDL